MSQVKQILPFKVVPKWYDGATWFYSKRTDPSDTPWSTNEHLNTPQNIPKYSPRQPHHTSDNHWTSPRQSYNFGAPESISEFLRGVWGVFEGCLRVVLNFWRSLAVSLSICRCLLLCEGVWSGVWVYLGDILGCRSWLGMYKGIYVGSVWAGSSQD